MHRIFYCLLPLAAAGAVPAQAQSGAWRVSEVSGDVRIAEAGRSRAATRGALLSGGSVIAGARSRAVLVRGRQYMVVSPGSTVRVDSPAGGANSVVDVAVEAGTALFKVDRRENPHFRVRTRFLAAVVRGTTFSVSVTPAGGAVQVTEGAVQVSSLDGGATDLIRPGMIARIGASDLFRLTVSGDQEKVIRSPAAPASTVTTAVPRGNGVGLQSAAQPPARIAAPVGEAPVRLREATKGLVSGAPAINLALLGRGGGASAEGNRGSGNDRDDRGSRGARDDEREDNNARGNGNGRDEEDAGKEKDEERPGNGNGRGNDDDAKPGNGGEDDDQGKDKDKDKDKDEDSNGDPDSGHGNDEDRDDEDNPANGGGKDNGGDDDDDDSPGNGGGKDDGGDEDDTPGDGGGKDDDDKPGDGKDEDDDDGRGNDEDGKDKDDDDRPGGGRDDDDGKDKDDGDGDDGNDDDGGKDKDKDKDKDDGDDDDDD